MVSHCMCVCQVVVHFSIEKVEVDGPDFGNDCPALWALWLFMVCHVQSDCLNNLIDKHFLLYITLVIFNHRFKNRQTLFGILNTCNFSRTPSKINKHLIQYIKLVIFRTFCTNRRTLNLLRPYSSTTRVFHGRAARGLARASKSPKPAGPFNSGLGLHKFGNFYYIRCRKHVLFHVHECDITTTSSKPSIL